MPDWSSQAELATDAGIFVKLNHALLGVYAWEWLISLPFDWEVLTGRKPFRWPLAFYFANRYLLLAAMIGITVALDSTKEMNCQAIYAFNQFAGDAAVGLASINLSLRTLAIWSQNGWIKILLIVIILGHWSLILQGVLLKAHWDDQAATCVITSSNSTILAATFTYSMGFDLLVFLLNAYKLGINRKGKSKLSKMIFTDGLIFFFIAFLANLAATIFMFLNLNSIMTIIFNVPAAMASTIVATRAVRRLTSFTHQGPEMYAPSGSGTGNFRNHSGNRGLTTSTRGGVRGVHVQMETFVREDGPVSPAVEYEVNELELKSQDDDIEVKAAAL
ncbi:hypothetical protein DFH08DRAFT_1079162 [Mycena albidolilacea]|uniref:Transmembrane protein n=1 Tax=Mycena albidolilacea TaxID=1033008 RepID=A0AAD7EU87_9AGAR|nr:hypothetical protein DFH08DRAFT_1079162 [Mycena albidolilacea]